MLRLCCYAQINQLVLSIFLYSRIVSTSLCARVCVREIPHFRYSSNWNIQSILRWSNRCDYWLWHAKYEKRRKNVSYSYASSMNATSASWSGRGEQTRRESRTYKFIQYLCKLYRSVKFKQTFAFFLAAQRDIQAK